MIKNFALIFALIAATASLSFGTPISSQLPPGAIFAFGGTACPAGSISANGASLLRAGTYAALFTAIGTVWGTADGTHFNVPPMNGNFPRGWANGSSNDPDRASRTACATGGATGDNVGTCQSYQYQAHTHGLNTIRNSTQAYQVIASGNGADFLGPSGGVLSNSSGGNETRPINVAVLYCIKY